MRRLIIMFLLLFTMPCFADNWRITVSVKRTDADTTIIVPVDTTITANIDTSIIQTVVGTDTTIDTTIDLQVKIREYIVYHLGEEEIRVVRLADTTKIITVDTSFVLIEEMDTNIVTITDTLISYNKPIDLLQKHFVKKDSVQTEISKILENNGISGWGIINNADGTKYIFSAPDTSTIVGMIRSSLKKYNQRVSISKRKVEKK